MKIPRRGNYDFFRRKRDIAHTVLATIIKGAYRCMGARGNMYKLLENFKMTMTYLPQKRKLYDRGM